MIAEDLGRLFEIGFNLGILAYIKQNKLENNFKNIYEKHLEKLRFTQINQRIIQKHNIVNESDCQLLKKWNLFFLQRGFLSGYNFFREYINTVYKRLTSVEIIYFQCNFCDDNSWGINVKGETATSREILSQLGDRAIDINLYRKKGEFLKADTLIVLKKRNKIRILSVDLSIFSVKAIEDIEDLDNIEILRRLLIKDIVYLKSKSVFAHLNVDTEGSAGKLGVKLPSDLSRYFTAFKRADKESAKLIQAASYAYSFYNFYQPEEEVTFTIVGYSDRGLSTLSVTEENIEILETCQKIYKEETNQESIKEAREKVLRAIKRNAAASFDDGKKFMKSLFQINLGQINIVKHQERITGFFNSIGEVSPELIHKLGLPNKMNLRDAHAQLIQNALESSIHYLFLTGNPGIGKTTAIVKFLEKHSAEGFIFFYVSPRKQVNLDVIEKFKEFQENTRIFCLNTNAEIIQSNRGKLTVEYVADFCREDFVESGVHFIYKDGLRRRNSRPKRQLRQNWDNSYESVRQACRGVLDSICQGIQKLIDRQITKNIVATVSLQSLKKLSEEQDTLQHFDKIFLSAYNKSEDKVIPHNMREISKKFKHFFIMIDEITGDHAGVEFLSQISGRLNKYSLQDYGFNSKIIVADASIVTADVIKKHLSNPEAEPDKIFYRVPTIEDAPLSVEHFEFKRKKALVINSNSYPASALNISYKCLIQSRKVESISWVEQKSDLINELKSEIIRDITALMKLENGGQIIVYIQDKERLKEITEKLQKRLGKFELFEHYIEIHSHISEEEKERIHQNKNLVKVVFMTSSASRGLSFPKAKHILVDIPRFSIEQNLMEIIQVIYRGRGSYRENGQYRTLDNQEKDLIFYFSERAIYNNNYEESKLCFDENLLNLVDILLILKTSIMTRILGSGKVGRQKLMMIPIGGKSVFSAGESFSVKLAHLIKALKKEHLRRHDDKLLKETADGLEDLLGTAKMTIHSTHSDNKSCSYLSIRESFSERFLHLANLGLFKLMELGEIENSHIFGSLLIVPLKQKKLKEEYSIRLVDFSDNFVNNLSEKLRAINRIGQYPPHLRSGTWGAIELTNLLLGKEDDKRTQWLEQNSQRFDQYYAIPLFTFVSRETMKGYFSSDKQEPEWESFRQLLESYLRAEIPISNVLPIGRQYGEFPFLIFTSYSLEEIRNKLFTDKHLLTSTELNVLNLILSQSEGSYSEVVN